MFPPAILSIAGGESDLTRFDSTEMQSNLDYDIEKEQSERRRKVVM